MPALYNDSNNNNVLKISAFIADALLELRAPRMHWPSRAESMRAFYAVLALLAVAAALTGGVDAVLTRFLDPLL